MPINCLVKCLIKFWTVIFQNQFMVNSWTIHEHSCFKKTALSPFALRLLSPPLFLLLLSLPLLLSLFNTHPVQPTNFLKTKDLRKRHFWLKILSQGKLLRLKTLGKKLPNDLFTSPPTLHSTRRPKLTLHAPPRNPTSCKVLCRICRPNPTHPTPLIIKF